MPVTQFNNEIAIPADSVGGALTDIKFNTQIIRDIMAASGFVQGFNMSITGANGEGFFSYATFTRGSEIVYMEPINFGSGSTGDILTYYINFYSQTLDQAGFMGQLAMQFNSEDMLISANWINST